MAGNRQVPVVACLQGQVEDYLLGQVAVSQLDLEVDFQRVRGADCRQVPVAVSLPAPEADFLLAQEEAFRRVPLLTTATSRRERFISSI